METLKLFSEAVEEVQYICEEREDGKKNYKIKGIFMQADIKNRNGRVYPMPVLEKEVSKYNKNFIQEKRAFGELGHPDGPTVNLDRVSHKITDLRQEGKNFVGKAQILSTPMGKIAESLLKDGVTLGVSSRGIGSLRDNTKGYKEVGEDFMLATAADIVADPSAPDAFVQGIMEGKEWVWDGGLLKERLANQTRIKIERATRARNLEEQKLGLFQDFLNSL